MLRVPCGAHLALLGDVEVVDAAAREARHGHPVAPVAAHLRKRQAAERAITDRGVVGSKCQCFATLRTNPVPLSILL